MNISTHTPKGRNPIYPEGTFQHADYTKIAIKLGLSRTTVVATLLYQTRHNQQVLEAAAELADFNRKFFNKK